MVQNFRKRRRRAPMRKVKSTREKTVRSIRARDVHGLCGQTEQSTETCVSVKEWKRARAAFDNPCGSSRMFSCASE